MRHESCFSKRRCLVSLDILCHIIRPYMMGVLVNPNLFMGSRRCIVAYSVISYLQKLWFGRAHALGIQYASNKGFKN